MGRLNDLTGKKFNRLLVIERVGSNSHKKALWKCECDCGNIITVIGSNLLNGNTHSWGCYKSGNTSARNSSHGKSQTRLYHIWKNMRQRCNNPNKPDYEYYGGGGITVCSMWDNFIEFEKWAYKKGYTDDLTIDRINVNEGYSPNNCRWVDMKTQDRNTTRNRRLTFKGETHCLSEWGEIMGISHKTIGNRINAYGWSIERALTTPVRGSENER